MQKQGKFTSLFWGLLYISYIFLLLYIARFEAYTKLINKIISPLLAFWIISIFFLLKKIDKIPKEIFLQVIFILWASNGISIAVNNSAFVNYYKILIESLFLYLLLYIIVLKTYSGLYVFWSLVIVGFALIINSLISKDLIFAFTVPYYRARSIAKNPNEFAYALLMGIWGILYLWGLYKSKIMKIFFTGLSMLMIIGIIGSASRKTFITLIIFFAAWIVYANKEFVKNQKSILIMTIILSVSTFVTINQTLDKSQMLRRFQYIFQAKEMGEDPTGGRINLYIDGLRVVREHPIFGVGLGNFIFYTIYGRKYTHSDFMEVATNTGLVGLIIYLLIYIVLWKRLSKTLNLLKIVPIRSPKTLRRIYEVKLMQLILLSHIIIGLGRPHFIDIYSLSMIGILISYSYILRKVVISEIVSQTL